MTDEIRLNELHPGHRIFTGGREVLNGRDYMVDAKGALVPLESVKATDKLMDETVRKVLAFAAPLADQIARFKQHCFDDVDAFVALLEQEYGKRPGGQKGNITLTTFDGCLKVQVQVSDDVTFGPELQIAKGLVDDCLREWSADSRPELRSIVERAFNVDREGRVNRYELLRLLRLEISDSRWTRAMDAIRDSMRVVGSKRYVRFYRRNDPQGAWEAVSIDVAAA